MYCRKCGSQVNDQAAVCSACGTTLTKTGAETGESAPSPTVQYAGFWRRLGASLIDMFILQTLTMIPVVFLYAVGILGIFSETFNAVYRVVFVIVCVVLAVLQLLYWPWMESSRRQSTLGKGALDVVVTDIDGRRISFARAVGRNLGKIVSYMLYYVGFFMIAFTPKKQGLHDMMAGCLVIVKK